MSASRFEDLSRGRRAALLTTIALVVMATLALLAEGAVRLRQHLKQGAGTVQDAFAYDERLGLRVMKPGARFGGAIINAHGFRGPEPATPRPPGVLRIAFVGGSTTLSAEASNEAATWPAIVARRLDEVFPGVSVDYVNAGVSGYTSATSAAAFAPRVAPFEPNLVVIYHGTNDLSRIGRDLAIEAGAVAADDGPGEGGWSLLLDLALKNLRILWLKQGGDPSSHDFALDEDEFARRFAASLHELIASAQMEASVVAIATFAPRLRREQSEETRREAAVTSRYYMSFLSVPGLISAFERVNGVIRVVAAETGAVLIADEHAIPADETHYVDSVHLSDAGSEAMAARVVAALAASPEVVALVAQIAEDRTAQTSHGTSQ